jgi:hypothetical protein
MNANTGSAMKTNSFRPIPEQRSASPESSIQEHLGDSVKCVSHGSQIGRGRIGDIATAARAQAVVEYAAKCCRAGRPGTQLFTVYSASALPEPSLLLLWLHKIVTATLRNKDRVR